MADLLTEEQIEDYKEVFRKFDKNGDGHITVKELGSVMKSLGFNLTKADLKTIIKEIDENENGTIECGEFLTMMSNFLNDPNMHERVLLETFETLDKDGNGYITATEFRQVAKTFGIKVTEKQAEEWIKESDLDGDGRVNYEEFLQMRMPKEGL